MPSLKEQTLNRSSCGLPEPTLLALSLSSIVTVIGGPLGQLTRMELLLGSSMNSYTNQVCLFPIPGFCTSAGLHRLETLMRQIQGIVKIDQLGPPDLKHLPGSPPGLEFSLLTGKEKSAIPSGPPSPFQGVVCNLQATSSLVSYAF